MRRCGVMVAVLIIAGLACSRGHGRSVPTPVTAPTTAPSPATSTAADGTFNRPDLGVRVDWPAGWVKQPSNDFVLLVARQGGDGSSTLSLDVPALPPHIPGLIPIGSVRGGYVDDLRKSAGTLKTTDLSPPALPQTSERFVRSTWTADGVEWQETALLMVHGDRVYILRGKSKTSDEPATRAAFDAVATSLQWTK